MTYDEMRIRQAWPYEIKIAHAKRVAAEFIEKVFSDIEYGGDHGNKYQAHNVHISVGGLDSITLLIFLRTYFSDVDIPAISRSALEDKSIQRIHKQLGVQSIPGEKTKTSILRDFGFPLISKAKASKIEKLPVRCIHPTGFAQACTGAECPGSGDLWRNRTRSRRNAQDYQSATYRLYHVRIWDPHGAETSPL